MGCTVVAEVESACVTSNWQATIFKIHIDRIHPRSHSLDLWCLLFRCGDANQLLWATHRGDRQDPIQFCFRCGAGFLQCASRVVRHFQVASTVRLQVSPQYTVSFILRSICSRRFLLIASQRLFLQMSFRRVVLF